MIRRNALWLCNNHCCENTASTLRQSCAAVSAGLEVSHRAVQWSQFLVVSCRSAPSSQELQCLTILDEASWMHLHNCRCFQEHLRMLLQSLRALCFAQGGSGSIWKYFEALVMSPGVSGRIACGFQTELYIADIQVLRWFPANLQCPAKISPELPGVSEGHWTGPSPEGHCIRWVNSGKWAPWDSGSNNPKHSQRPKYSGMIYIYRINRYRHNH